VTRKIVLDVPGGMQKIHRRFECWRSWRQGRLRLRRHWASLWTPPGSRSTKILRREYAKLKHHESAALVKRRTASPTEFLELVRHLGGPPIHGLKARRRRISPH
jgi:hypothetical protein